MLLHGHYVIPNWHLRYQRILYWDKFSRPEATAKFGTATNLWWFDTQKAARLEATRRAAPDMAASGRQDRPGLGMTLAAVAGVLLAAFFVFRRILHKPPA